MRSAPEAIRRLALSAIISTFGFILDGKLNPQATAANDPKTQLKQFQQASETKLLEHHMLARKRLESEENESDTKRKRRAVTMPELGKVTPKQVPFVALKPSSKIPTLSSLTVKILLIESDLQLPSEYVQSIKKTYQVHTWKSERSPEQIVPDLVLLVLKAVHQIPEMCSMLQSVYNHLPSVIVISTQETVTELAKAHESGQISDFLTLPFSSKLLMRRLAGQAALLKVTNFSNAVSDHSFP